MNNRPLLFFPAPEKADRTKPPGGHTKYHYPTHGQQEQRLTPKFEQLRKSFSALNANIQITTSGIDPEQVLVFETIGSVKDFANAVVKIEGFEWLGEFYIEEIAPDDDFYAEKDKTKNLNGQLYLILSNQRAFNELFSLWQQYKKNPNMKWDRGLTKFRDVFNCLKEIRQWGIQDRINKKEIQDYLEDELKYGDKKRLIPLEIELWYRKNNAKRQKSIGTITELINEIGGKVHAQSEINEIQYIGILAYLPVDAIQNLIGNQDITLIKSDEIKFLHATGQMAVGRQPTEGEPEYAPIEEQSLPHDEPTIALFDGLPLANHDSLEGRLIIDDPDNYETNYPAEYRKHGTAMASLITRGDLNESEQPLARPIYVRPIFKPILWQSTQHTIQNLEGRESVPQDCLLVDLIHRSVKRLFEGESDNIQPVAPNVKIINLSLGDPTRPFYQFMSPLARLLDWLSTKYNVLFIVSAGNCSDDITFDHNEDEFNALTPSEKESESVLLLYQNICDRRLLSPAESINALTIGALHYDTSTIEKMGRRINILEHLLPSPVSTFGSGYRKSVKPDLIFNAGRQLYTIKPNSNNTQTTLEINNALSTPGIRTAYPSPNGFAYTCGTSNATALISRAAGQCYDTILNIIEDNNVNVESDQVIALLKTMVVHSCSWAYIGEQIDNILRTPDNRERSDIVKSNISRWLGYGVPQIQRMFGCTEQRVTLLGFGRLQVDDAAVFRLPLPPSLSGKNIKRRLTVTLSWMSPISPSTHKYRAAQLWFELINNNIVQQRRDVKWRMVRRGTVQHEIFEGEINVPYSENEVLEIKVNCKKDAGQIVSPIAYGLAVSLEVADGTNIAIYDEVQTRLAQLVPVQTIGTTR
ncbi:MAG: S8 family peptidase [Planctomycetaceae bacterium]|jgi:hypothetical protein|nr:S8 family peptidase [Planctomycetaceae bacterium]